MAREIEIQQIELEVAQISQSLDELDGLTLQYSTTNVLVQAPNLAESTFVIVGSALASESIPVSSNTTPTVVEAPQPATMPMSSGY